MGTLVRVVLYAESEGAAAEGARDAFAEIASVDAAMSDYNPESELRRLSASSGDRPVSPPLFDVLSASHRYSVSSGGAFDITVGPVVRLWRRARKEGKLPGDAEIREAMTSVGYRKLVLDPDRRTARLDAAGMFLDLGGIAKGYACDRALAALARRGVRVAMVDASGGMALGDPPPGQNGWRIQLGDEEGRVLHLSNCGVATSGDTEQYLEVDGHRYSHIVDPRTGYALKDGVLATVVAPDGMGADALATALSVMGPDAGLNLAESLDGVEAWMRWKEGSAQTSGLEALLR